MQTVRDAIAAAQAKSRAEGEEIAAGEALAVIADHFVDEWERHHPDCMGLWRSGRRRKVLLRKAGLCSVPGCSRAAVHVHHVVFRSRGGPKEEWNEIGICAVHHLHGIHLGYLEVTGRAGERLHWRFATGEAVPTEEWVTFGDDDVRRAGSTGGEGAPGARGGGARAGPAAGADAVAPGFTDVNGTGDGAPDAGGVAVTDAEPTGDAEPVGSAPDGAAFVAEEAPDLTWLTRDDAPWPTWPSARVGQRRLPFARRPVRRKEVAAAR